MTSGSYKRTKEHNRKIGESNKGKTYSKETKMKISESLIKYFKENDISEETREKISKALKGRVISEKKKESMRGGNNYFYGKHYYGENSPSWKGGITPLVVLIRNSLKYRQWRDDVFTRDSFACQECGDNRGGNLEAHHIKLLTSFIYKYEITTNKEAFECEELWSLNNGKTLCEECHRKIHKERGQKVC